MRVEITDTVIPAAEAAIRNHVRRAQQARIKLLLQNG